MKKGRMRGRWTPVVLIVVAVSTGSYAFARSSSTPTSSGRLNYAPATVPPHTFVSLVPACGCAQHEELDEFSTQTGRRLGELAPVPFNDIFDLPTPAAQADGRILLTFTQGPTCAVTGNYSQCPRISPNSCVNQVDSLAAGQRHPTSLFTVPGSLEIGDVVPSPDGSQVAFSQTPCTQPHGITGLFVRDLSSRRERAVVKTTNACDGFGRAAWNAAGTKLVFTYDHANGQPATSVGGEIAFCPAARNRLAIVSARPTAPSQPLELIAPDSGCAFQSAAFASQGVVAAEGCDQGSPDPTASDATTGNAYLLQLNLHGRVLKRFALKRGLEEALVATEPHSNDMLITQDQPANNDGPEDDWVWEFDGSRLRPIAHYRAVDAAQVIAVPW